MIWTCQTEKRRLQLCSLPPIQGKMPYMRVPCFTGLFILSVLPSVVLSTNITSASNTTAAPSVTTTPGSATTKITVLPYTTTNETATTTAVLVGMTSPEGVSETTTAATTTAEPTSTTLALTTTKEAVAKRTTASEKPTSTTVTPTTTTTETPLIAIHEPPATTAVKMEVLCLEDSIHVALEESGQIQLNKDNLRLSDPNCTLHSNGTHLLANVPLNGCDTQVEDAGTYLIFTNMILSYDDPSAIITRELDVDIEFLCKYSKRGDAVLSLIAHKPTLTFTEEFFGTFTHQFEFFESQAFIQQKDPNSYPLEFDVGDMMYMQIESITSVPNTELFAESCRATPSGNPHDTISYPIILNGCKVDRTVQIYANGNRSKVQFAMKTFNFMGHHDQVYITCSVILCEAGKTNSRCSQGCSRSIQISKREASFQTATNHSSWHRIHKRDVHVQGSGHFISQGPLRLRHRIDSPVAEGMNMNLIFCVSCLLAAIAMVCGVVVYRTPRSPNTGMV